MLAIAGGKGGSGKTTTTLGLAAALDGPTLAVDADADMPNLHSLAAVDRDPTIADLADDPEAVVQPHPVHPDVGVLAAPHADEDVDVTASLSRLDRFDCVADDVLVDCPAGAGPDAVAPVRVADAALLVSPLCGPALRDAAKTAAMARAVGTPPIGAVLTRARIAPDGVADLLGCPVLGTIPTAEAPVLEDAAVRSAYRELANSVRPKEDLL
jgi:septum site-determining protein MinD